MRPRQRLILAPVGAPVFTRWQANERGEYELKEVDETQVVLPECSTTDIQAMFAAGIDPKRVNTKIIPSSTIVTDLSVDRSEDNNQTEDKGE